MFHFPFLIIYYNSSFLKRSVGLFKLIRIVHWRIHMRRRLQGARRLLSSVIIVDVLVWEERGVWGVIDDDSVAIYKAVRSSLTLVQYSSQSFLLNTHLLRVFLFFFPSVFFFEYHRYTSWLPWYAIHHHP